MRPWSTITWLDLSTRAASPIARKYELIEVDAEDIPKLSSNSLGKISYILGEPALEEAVLNQMQQLKCIFNVESNLMDNMPYDLLFQRGINVVMTGAIFAQPVAELGLGQAL